MLAIFLFLPPRAWHAGHPSRSECDDDMNCQDSIETEAPPRSPPTKPKVRAEPLAQSEVMRELGKELNREGAHIAHLSQGPSEMIRCVESSPLHDWRWFCRDGPPRFTRHIHMCSSGLWAARGSYSFPGFSPQDPTAARFCAEVMTAGYCDIRCGAMVGNGVLWILRQGCPSNTPHYLFQYLPAACHVEWIRFEI